VLPNSPGGNSQMRIAPPLSTLLGRVTGGATFARRGTGRAHLADFGILIWMNRKCGLLHPMLVDVDLKEGYPDGRA
jgi:hypothetical protein